jgi:glycerol-3-phosphate dehydrogenase
MPFSKKPYETDVVIIGGGITGAGLARDCARRGLRCALIEKNDFAAGATGRNHGLLHSGARYAVTDQESARECIEENRILRVIARHCIEESDGLFLSLPGDSLDYQKTLLDACRAAGIAAETVSPEEALRLEPAANPALIGAVRVPDGVVDPFRLTMANIQDAIRHHAVCLTYHEVVSLLRRGDRITGVQAYDRLTRNVHEIRAAMVINAAGIWGQHIASLADVRVSMFPTRGSLLILGHRLNRMVLNRCRKPADADILVPGDTVSLIGTTSISINFNELDDMRTTAEEVDILIREGALLAPDLARIRKIRCYAGARPLPADESDPTGRRISRKIVLLDHAARDGLEGFVTITGGKLVTYRLMAEMAADLVCRKLGVTASCDTAVAILPGSGGAREETLRALISLPPAQRAALAGRHGDLAADMAKEPNYDVGLVCECETVSAGEIRHAIDHLLVRDLIDLRRRTRIGMGPCQGEMCAYRAAGLLVHHGVASPETMIAQLVEFLEERWKGIRPLLWGDSLRESEFTQWTYREVCGLAREDGKKPADGENPAPSGNRQASLAETPPAV